MKLAVIPARGGSQRIPRKNIRLFCGEPMLTWSIRAALSSGCFDRVMVSTDDADIAEVARASGAEVPFLRPAHLSDHHTPTRPVVNHAIEEAEKRWGRIDQVCCVYATAPFVNGTDLRAAWERWTEAGTDFAFSVTSYAFPIQRALRLLPEGGVGMFQPAHAGTRSQDLEPAFHDAGQFYWGQAQAFRAGVDIYSARSLPVFMPRHRVQDIDTPEDWERAEWLMRALLAQEHANDHA